MHLPSFQGLIAFEVAARQNSFAAAANELCITPSALSHRLRLLEECLGEKLFIRSRKETVLTELGARYLLVVKESLHPLKSFSVSLSENEKRSVKVTVPPTFARLQLIPKLSKFTEKYPDINVEVFLSVPLYNLKPHEDTLEIRYGKCEKLSGFTCKEIINGSILPVASPDYINKVGPLDKPEDLYHASLLTSPLEPWEPWFAITQLDSSKTKSSMCFYDLGLLLEATLCGYGVSLARDEFVQPLLDQGRLVEVCNHRVHNPDLNYYIHYSDSAKDKSANSLFINWLSHNFCEA